MSTEPLNPPAARRRALRFLVQAAGIGLGVASLWWCIHKAMAEQNREQLALLWSAPPRLVALMVGLSLATLAINGLLFWIMLTPVRRLPLPAVLATQGLCCFLGYLPLKLGAAARVVIHNRRDRLPLALIGAWFLSMVVVMALALAPPVGASLALKRVDGRWWAIVVVLEIVLAAALPLGALAFRGEHGLGRLSRVLGAIPVLPLSRLLRTRLWGDLHRGFEMLADVRAVGGSVALRMADLAVQTARFMVAAAILRIEMAPAQAMLVSLCYFVIGIVSPVGLAGLREGGATLAGAGVLKWFGGGGEGAVSLDAFAALVLLVTATEVVANAIGGVLGAAYLRPDRLLRLRASAPAPLEVRPEQHETVPPAR